MSIQNEEAIVKLIFHGGNIRQFAYSAIEAAEKNDFPSAAAHLQKADQEFAEGHQWQTKIVSSEQRDGLNASFLLIHGQDHFMTAKAELEMAKRLVTSYKKHEELAARIADLESDK
ncbi:N,N'-diacetylchitobiose-specific phosphotransferase enzyme IIA component [Listeria grayi]|uniref:N,N'-diacetylchitobiose-specific phosphotransferase enzyme IIA component n=1 Tax=Listeria grayi TaxID=1641 RepID=A0A378MF48_LISGR|nr:PTS lactose/cellobiose transporter subunit IIA [Listeria grayi]STY44136.1 N,N'-diacetylchitobiose-specific phosphotransferase enzyme IIA component [Listeria grayi]